MKNKFISPTLKNMLLVFFVLQIVPLALTFLMPKISLLLLWAGYQLAPLGLLVMMPIKPISEMDERELFLTSKWQARSLNFILPCLIIPLLWLAFDPDVKSWTILYSFIVPVCFIMFLTSLLYKREFGAFYVR